MLNIQWENAKNTTETINFFGFVIIVSYISFIIFTNSILSTSLQPFSLFQILTSFSHPNLAGAKIDASHICRMCVELGGKEIMWSILAPFKYELNIDVMSV